MQAVQYSYLRTRQGESESCHQGDLIVASVVLIVTNAIVHHGTSEWTAPI